MTQVLPTFEDVFESLPRQNKLRDVGHAVACGLLDRNSRVVNNILDFCESDGMFPDPNAGRFSELVRTDFYRATHCRRMQAQLRYGALNADRYDLYQRAFTFGSIAAVFQTNGMHEANERFVSKKSTSGRVTRAEKLYNLAIDQCLTGDYAEDAGQKLIALEYFHRSAWTAGKVMELLKKAETELQLQMFDRAVIDGRAVAAITAR